MSNLEDCQESREGLRRLGEDELKWVSGGDPLCGCHPPEPTDGTGIQ